MDVFTSLKKFIFNEPEEEQVKRDIKLVESFSFTRLSHHGMLGFPNCLTFDPLRRLLAVGSQTGGLVKIYGAPFIETIITSTADGPVCSLQFLHDGNLIVGFRLVVEIWSISSRTLLRSWQFSSSVVTVHSVFGTETALMGLLSGEVHAFNVSKDVTPSYKIDSTDLKQANESVVAIQAHPENETWLLIGYKSSIVEWDIVAKKVRNEYTLANIKPLSAICWNHDGSRFVSGHEDGQLAVWRPGKSTPLKAHYLKGEDEQERRPISQIIFTKATVNNGEFPCIFILGGVPFREQRSVMVGILKDNKIQNSGAIGPREKTLDVACFDLVFSSPWRNEAINPSFLLYVTNNGRLYVHNIQNFKFIQTPLPPPLEIQHVPVIASEFFICPPELISDFGRISNINWKNTKDMWPISGGGLITSTEKPSKSKMLVTAHSNGHICFWDATTQSLQLLYRVPIVPTDFGLISYFGFCSLSRTLFVVTNRGHVLVYEFSLESRDVWIWEHGVLKKSPEESDNPKKDKEKEDQGEDPEIQQKNIEKKKQKGKKKIAKGKGKDVKMKEKQKEKKNSSGTSKKGEKTELEKLDNAPDPDSSKKAERLQELRSDIETAKQYAEKAQRVEILNQVVLFQQLIEDFPTTEITVDQEKVIDKLTGKMKEILAEINRAQNEQPPDPSLSNHSPHKNSKNFRNVVRSEPGFQLSRHIKWASKITTITFESGLGRIVFGDDEGKLSEFMIGSEPTLVYSKEIEPKMTVTHIRYYQHESPTASILLLYLTLNDGRIFVLDTARGTIVRGTKDATTFPIKYLVCITASASLWRPEPKRWGDVITEGQDPQKVIPNKDVSKQTKIYLLTCSTRSLVVYILPTLEKVHQIDFGVDIVWARLLHVEEEHTKEGFVALIDAAQTILVFKLLELGPLPCHTKGASQGAVRVSDKLELRPSDISLATCCSDGDMFFYFNGSEMCRMTLFPQINGNLASPIVVIPDVMIPPKIALTMNLSETNLIDQTSETTVKNVVSPRVGTESENVPRSDWEKGNRRGSFVEKKRILHSDSNPKPEHILEGITSPRDASRQNSARERKNLISPRLGESSNFPESPVSREKANLRQNSLRDKRPLSPHSYDKDIYGERDVELRSNRPGKITQLTNAIHENIQLLNERGDRINDLGDKTQEIANESQTLADGARKLQKQLAHKRWF